MNKKYFVAIANILRAMNARASSTGNNKAMVEADKVIEDFAQYLKTQNRNFDRLKFLAACNGQ